MSGYTKTTILECARSQSAEAQAKNNSNPAQWTCAAGGDGFRVKPGDQISVHSSFISELGAQSGEIQIKGESLGKTVEVEITNRENLLPDLDDSTLPQVYGIQNASQIKKTIDIRDDTLNLVVSPYKTSNGENYAFLPRQWVGIAGNASVSYPWDSFDQCDGAVPLLPHIGNVRYPRPALNQCPADVHKVFTPHRSDNEQVKSKIAGKNDGSRFTLFTRTSTNFGSPTEPVTVVGQSASGVNTITPKHGSVTTGVLVGMALYGEHPTGPGNVFPTNCSVIAVTDSTITMFANASSNTTSNHLFNFRFITSTTDQFLPPTTLNSEFNASECEALRDPAVLGDYIQVKNLIELKVNPGYNSPTDVAVQLSEEINQRSEIEYFDYEIVSSLSLVTQPNQRFSFKTETPSYQMYNCATASGFSSGNYTQWEKVDGTWDIEQAYEYLSSYQHIGIKRPEFYLAGKELNASIGFTTRQDTPNIFGNEVFVSGLPWTRENLLKFKNFFDSQSIYSDLFEGFKQNDFFVQRGGVIDTRLLHMNLVDSGPLDLETNVPIKSEKTPAFGYDYYNNALNANQGSFPLFVDYNPNTADFTDIDVGFTDYGFQGTSTSLRADYNDLAYGFGRKVKRGTIGGDKYYIGFQFSRTGNKIPDHFYQINASAANEKEIGTGSGRRFGFDYHFSAYGNLTMILTNGNPDVRGTDRGELSTKSYTLAGYNNGTPGDADKALDRYQFGLYLGADGPIINYDQEQQRFQLERFHTPELVGNVYDAGANKNSAIVPTNPDADQDCYKINKRSLDCNYTPEMAPYQEGISGIPQPSPPYDVSTLISHNPNISEYKVMDAHSGLFIEDWVIPEDFWDDSLVGIMGFRYDQFHNPNSTNSRQVRIRAHGANADLNNVNIITTNAAVNETDLVEYSKNVFGSSTYQRTNTIQKQMKTLVDPTKDYNGAGARNITPAITVSPAQSVKINAQRLPTKTLRPYYTVRSDIISKNTYLGGTTSGITLPIVTVVNKANPYGDFLNGNAGQMTFTNTVDRVITDIRCSIHEPSGEFARVDNNSAVIFRVDQQVNADLNLVGTLMSSKNKQDQQDAQLAEDPDLIFQGVKYTKDLFQ